ncbi:MAG: L-2-amino-thiazoline-4-carboxylic acid hydrolase [Dysgonamonadaceae bacterium]|jgi:hypothetical protein|nr:L-2-amino-thiazoline-4-carboxylic acid hydrolase [Dysgonamonadaceae bacterium]
MAMKTRRAFVRALGLTSVGVLASGVTLRAWPSVSAGTDAEQYTVLEVRKAARHFAMLYFNFCKTLVGAFGQDEAYELTRRAIFNLALDRTDRMREKALSLGLSTDVESFDRLTDLPSVAWRKWDSSSGEVRCPYAQAWLGYFDLHPWFARFASLYCDVVDTTNIENFSRTTSHRITKNLLWGDADCEREFFESDQVKSGSFTYGVRE